MIGEILSTQTAERLVYLDKRVEELETINEEHRKINGELRNRINKAIEMFNNETLNKYYYGMSYEFEINDFKEDMLNILQESDE